MSRWRHAPRPKEITGHTRSIPEAMNDLHSRSTRFRYQPISTPRARKTRGMPAAAFPSQRPSGLRSRRSLSFARIARNNRQLRPASAMGYIGSRNWPENRRSWIAGPDRASADYLRGGRANRRRSAFHFMMEVEEGCPADRIGPPWQGEGAEVFRHVWGSRIL